MKMIVKLAKNTGEYSKD